MCICYKNTKCVFVIKTQNVYFILCFFNGLSALLILVDYPTVEVKTNKIYLIKIIFTAFKNVPH